VQRFPNTASFAGASSVSRALCIEHSVTVDMANGQPLPPYFDDGVACLVPMAARCGGGSSYSSSRH
jgi:hypothetical protein